MSVSYKLDQMREKAVETVALRIKTTMADQWRPLKDAGWNDDDVRFILDEAVKQCDSYQV